MRAVLQRVSRARVTVEGRVTGESGVGLMILLGVGREDTSLVASSMAEKCAKLRIFDDQQGKMNLSLLDVQGGALVVSQFTTHAGSGGPAIWLRPRRRSPSLSMTNSARRSAGLVLPWRPEFSKP